MRMPLILATAFVLGLPAAGAAVAQQPAEQWVEVFQHALGPVFIDTSSVRREGAVVTLRSRVNFTETQEDGTSSAITRFRYDCAARTADLMAFTQYRADGSVLLAEEVPEADRVAEGVPDGTPNAAILARVCR